MPQSVVTREKTFTAGAALLQYRRVRLSSGKLAYCSNSHTDGIGTLTRDTFADGDKVAVDLISGQGTKVMIAAGEIAAGVKVYAATNGRVDDTGTVFVGMALSAAGADGDHIEVLESRISAAAEAFTEAAVVAALGAGTAAAPTPAAVDLDDDTGATPDVGADLDPVLPVLDDDSTGTPDDATWKVVAPASTDYSTAELKNNFATIAAAQAANIGVLNIHAATIADAYNGLKVDVEANEAEIVKLVADIAAIRTSLNAILTSLKNASLMASA